MSNFKKKNLEISRFIFIGIFSVLIDFLVYKILINLSFIISFAKGISFITGSLFTYFANKKFTFKARGSKRVFFKFTLVYSTSFFLNIFLNNFILLNFYFRNLNSLLIAFIFSTLFSAIYNFIGFKKFVFRGN